MGNIKWPELGQFIVAGLNDEGNPEMCKEFWEDMRDGFKVLQAHPVVSSEPLYAWGVTNSTAPSSRQSS